MIDQALTLLRNEFRQGANPQVISTGDPNSATVFFPSTGKVERFAKPPAPRTHRFVTIPDFVAAVQKYGQAPSVYVQIDGAQCILVDADEGHRQAVIHLDITPSDVFEELAALGQPMKQEQLVRLLRTKLSLCQWDKDFKASVEIIRFVKNESGGGDLSAGRNSLGREVQAEVSGLKQPIPDKVTCTFLPYPEIDGIAPVSVDCNVIVDHVRAEFILQPQPHAVDAARIRAQNLVKQVLGEELECGIYLGTP